MINNHPQQESKSPTGEISVSPGKSLKLHFEREISPIDDRSKDIFPQKILHLFPVSKKGQGRPPPLTPSSYAPAEQHILPFFLFS